MRKSSKAEKFLKTWIAKVIAGQVWQNKAVVYPNASNTDEWQIRVVEVKDGKVTYEMLNRNQITTRELTFRRKFAWYADDALTITQELPIVTI